MHVFIPIDNIVHLLCVKDGNLRPHTDLADKSSQVQNWFYMGATPVSWDFANFGAFSQTLTVSHFAMALHDNLIHSFSWHLLGQALYHAQEISRQE